jgi:7,8-dihydropterin-6-yl-methyl-4-(beta-D-ribofuranosyl)aminobenzene 5'-phosphate synthase
MRYRITVLCENSVGPLAGTLGEHGFAVLIEPPTGGAVLFDTGQGLTLLHNARRMNKDLSAAEKVVVSHGHHDHAGGLLSLLREFGPRQVYGHPGIFAQRYRLKDTGECLPIGIPYTREELELAGARFDLSAQYRELAPGIWLTGEVPRVTAFEKGDQGLYRDRAGRHPDTTPDDQALLLEADRGLVIVLGCCHAGVVNTLEHIASKTGRRDVYAVIGGTHLGFCGQVQLEQTVAVLKRSGISRIAAGHCTGFDASAHLAREVPQAFRIAQVGYTLEV